MSNIRCALISIFPFPRIASQPVHLGLFLCRSQAEKEGTKEENRQTHYVECKCGGHRLAPSVLDLE